MAKKKEVKEEIKADVKTVKPEVEEQPEAKEEKVEVKEVTPKKTKAEINREIKEAAFEENSNRTDRKRAEKAARREAKAERKEANVVKEKSRKLGNGVLALMIFGMLALMFVVVWGYNYSQKEVSIASYIKNNGGAETYENIALSEEQSMSVTAKKNDMKIAIDVNCEHGDEDVKFYKSDEGVDQMKYMAAYYLGTIKPQVRGVSAKATVVAKVNGKKAKSVIVKWSEVDNILEKNGMSVESLQKQVNSDATTTTEE